MSEEFRRVLPVLAILICVVTAFGCASPRPFPRLSDSQCEDLYAAGHQLATKGEPVPKAIQDLKPEEVYFYRGNIVIALERNAQGEHGYYIIPTVSSYMPEPGQEWTFKSIGNTNMSLILEYWRTHS